MKTILALLMFAALAGLSIVAVVRYDKPPSVDVYLSDLQQQVDSLDTRVRLLEGRTTLERGQGGPNDHP